MLNLVQQVAFGFLAAGVVLITLAYNGRGRLLRKAHEDNRVLHELLNAKSRELLQKDQPNIVHFSDQQILMLGNVVLTGVERIQSQGTNRPN